MAGCAGWKEMRALINSKHKTMVGVIIFGVFPCMAAFTWISVAADGPPALETFELLTMHAYVRTLHVSCMHASAFAPCIQYGSELTIHTHTHTHTHKSIKVELTKQPLMMTWMRFCLFVLFACLFV